MELACLQSWGLARCEGNLSHRVRFNAQGPEHTLLRQEQGRSFCAKARRAIICYERFVAANASRINCGGSPYPATAELVTWCVLWTIDVSRERHARAAAKGGVAALRNFKGTSGNAQLKGLGMAYVQRLQGAFSSRSYRDGRG